VPSAAAEAGEDVGVLLPPPLARPEGSRDHPVWAALPGTGSVPQVQLESWVGE